jgi:hypothetical protein
MNWQMGHSASPSDGAEEALAREGLAAAEAPAPRWGSSCECTVCASAWGIANGRLRGDLWYAADGCAAGLRLLGALRLGGGRGPERKQNKRGSPVGERGAARQLAGVAQAKTLQACGAKKRQYRQRNHGLPV